MFDNKWTFSLTSLVVLLALGFAVIPLMAHKVEKGHGHMNVSFQIDRSVVDVSSESTKTAGIKQDIQIDSGRTRTYAADAFPRDVNLRTTGTDLAGSTPMITALVEFEKMVKIHVPELADDAITVGQPAAASGEAFGLDDFDIAAFDRDGRPIVNMSLFNLAYVIGTGGDYEARTGDDLGAWLSFTNPGGTQEVVPGELAGRQFTLEIYDAALETIASLLPERRGGDFEIATLIITLKSHIATESSLDLQLRQFANLKDDGVSLTDDAPKGDQGPEFPERIRIDLVDVDEGDPKYRTYVAAGTSTLTAVTDPSASDPYPATAADANPSGYPNVVSITRLRGTSHDINTPLGYGLAKNAAADADVFDVKIVLTEKPFEFTLNHIIVENGTAIAISDGFGFGNAAEGPADAPVRRAVMPPESEGGYAAAGVDGTAGNADDDPIPEPTGRDNQYWEYRVTIDPTRATSDDVVVSVDEFDDMVLPMPKTYTPLTERERKTAQRSNAATALINTRLKSGREILSIPVLVYSPDAAPDIFKPSADAKLPHEKFLSEGLVIPANGYLVLASGTYAQAGILASAAKTADKKRAGEDAYNTVEKFDPPHPGNDLANFFRNGATIQLVYQDIAGNTAAADTATGYAGASSAAIAPGSVIISEIMWAYDRGLDHRAYSEGQWIELHNTTSSPISLDKQEWMLVYGTSTSFTNGIVVDVAGNNPATGYWDVEGKGKHGVSSPDPLIKTGVAVEKEGTKEEAQVIDRTVEDVVSMSRVKGATDGTAELSWAMSELPTANFSSAGRIGTPGAENNYDMSAQAADAARRAAEDAAEKAAKAASEAAAAAAAAGMNAEAADIGITEIMVDTDGGRLPQWFELTNLSAGKVNLNGWTAVIDNAVDADVIGGGSPITISLDGIVLGVGGGMAGDQTGAGEGQSALLVAWATRHSANLDQAGISARTVNLSTQLEQTARYQLLSYMGFNITLMPPQDGAIATYGDAVGNLDMGWDILMAEGGRSSLIRREMDADGMEIMGTAANGWRLASATDLISGPTSWYGSDEDAGTPGYDSGGPLPVELSMFYPARDRLTGQVVITWETQSELNNAGFFIKRSQQRRGTFVVINATMVPGAGTTSEKQSYTYTDTTAQPNIVYYYQIEDVSLDGNRQLLTNGIRLRGHIGAAGKATTTWGEIKSSRD